MARIAEWRLAPGDPRRPLRWLVRAGFGWQWPREEALAKIGGPVLPVVVLAVAAQLWWLLGVVPLIVAVVGMRQTAIPAEHGAIPTLVDEEWPFPVAIQISYKGMLLGEDTGWLDFCESWLIYQGRRTDFSLTTRDVTLRPVARLPYRLTLSDGTSIEIRFVTSMTETVLPATQRDLTRFHQKMNRWMSQEPRGGEPVLPPTTIHPSAHVGRGQTYFFLGIAAMAVAAALALPFDLLADYIAFLTAGPLFLVAAINWLRIPAAHRQLVQATTASPYSPMPAEPLRP